MITAETGLVGPNPAARLKVAWSVLPSALKHWAKMYETYIHIVFRQVMCIIDYIKLSFVNFLNRVWHYIPASMLTGMIQQKDKNSAKHLSIAAVATSDRTLDLIYKTPTVRVITLFSQNI